MKHSILISGLLFCSACYAQTQTSTVPSTERKVMENKTEIQAGSSTGNAYLMSRSFKDSARSEVYIIPEVKAGSEQKKQTNAKNPH